MFIYRQVLFRDRCICRENIKTCKDNNRTLQNDRRDTLRLEQYLRYFKSFKRDLSQNAKCQLFNLGVGYTAVLLLYG